MTERETQQVLHMTGPVAVKRLRSLAESGSRTIVGLCGPPGAGKSTLAARFVAELGNDRAALLPMDGFHLANATLLQAGLHDVKGAIQTFDVGGYAALLGRLARNEEEVVYAPEFDRDLDEAIAGAISISRDVPLLIVEGNYLLAAEEAWAEARTHVDEVWYLDVDQDLRRRRLVERHVRYGKSPVEAEAWMMAVDEVNAEQIVATARRADAVVSAWEDDRTVGDPKW